MNSISKTSAPLRLCGENNNLEVVSGNAAESKAIVETCGQRVETFGAQLKRSERVTDGWRCLIGVHLMLAKPHLDHGEFEPFVQRYLPQYEKRTAERWMRFAETAIRKSDPGSLLKQLPEKASNGGIAESEVPTLTEALNALLGEEAFDDWTDANSERKKGGLLPITFHCPCGQKLKQIAGRNIKCPKCGETVKAKADVKDATSEERERVDGELNDLAAKLDGLVSAALGDKPNASERARCSDAAWRNLVRACQGVSTLDRVRKHQKQATK